MSIGWLECPQKLLTFKTFLLVGEGSDPDREDPNEILVLLTNLIFSWNKINFPGKNRTALEEVAMTVAGLQEMVLEAPGLEELAKEAPSLEELASKLALDGFV